MREDWKTWGWQTTAADDCPGLTGEKGAPVMSHGRCLLRRVEIGDGDALFPFALLARPV